MRSGSVSTRSAGAIAPGGFRRSAIGKPAARSRLGGERLQDRSTEELSARNRFRGVVRAVEVEGFLARVELDLTAPARVVAIITREAAEELDLKPGRAARAIVNRRR